MSRLSRFWSRPLETVNDDTDVFWFDKPESNHPRRITWATIKAAILAAVVVADEASEAAGVVAVIATTGGATTGLIPTTATNVTATTDSADKQISLPAAAAHKKIQIVVPTTGCELISVVAGDKVNSVVVGATNEAALVAGTIYSLEYDGTDNWVMTGVDALGAVETPVVPDALV